MRGSRLTAGVLIATSAFVLMSCSGASERIVAELTPSSPTNAQATPSGTKTPPTAAQTATPTPNATPTSTSTPTPTPTPDPLPMVFSGNGPDIVDVRAIGSTPALLYVKGNSSRRHFAVTGYDANQGRTDLFVNTTDPYEGIVPLNFSDYETTAFLEVTATGSWTIEIRSLRTARVGRSGEVISGKGDEVIITPSHPVFAEITGNSSKRYFGVKAYGKTSKLLVNTTDQYSGKSILPQETIVVVVTAAGDWQIRFD